LWILQFLGETANQVCCKLTNSLTVELVSCHSIQWKGFQPFRDFEFDNLSSFQNITLDFLSFICSIAFEVLSFCFQEKTHLYRLLSDQEPLNYSHRQAPHCRTFQCALFSLSWGLLRIKSFNKYSQLKLMEVILFSFFWLAVFHYAQK